MSSTTNITTDINKKEELQEILKNALKISYKIKNPNHYFTEFFNNSSKAIILDILFDNPDTDIYTMDLLKHAGLSRKVIYINIPILLQLNIISQRKIGRHIFFKLNKDSDEVKQISKFRDTLTYGRRGSNRRKLSEKKDNR